MLVFSLFREKIMVYRQKIITGLDKFSKNLRPTHTVMAIAAVKGICRPAFTMTEKNEKPETKKYTALREGITEAVAIPIYWLCGEAAGSGAEFLKKLNDNKLIASMRKTGETIDIEKLKQPAHITAKIANNLRFLGVCAAALIAIPAACSVIIKPIVNKIISPPAEANINNGNINSSLKYHDFLGMDAFISNLEMKGGSN